MDLLIVPVPLFNKDMNVEAYCFRYQKGSDYIVARQTMGLFDGAALSPPLETLNMVGVDAFTINQPVFVPVSHLMVLANLDQQCGEPPEKIIFLLGADVKPEEPYLGRIHALRKKGYRFAFSGITDLRTYAPLLAMGDYFLVDIQQTDERSLIELLRVLGWHHRNLKIVADNISTVAQYRSLVRRGFSLFEGPFYRVPLNRGQSDISPLKVNLIRLLNIVRDENFEFDVVAGIVQRDTALSMSLMRMVNSPYLGLKQKIKTINHAVTMLGQMEVRKWVTTSVSRTLGADKPNEITKLSLVRAKFAENLSPLFQMEEESQSLFLMALFSVLDVVLEMPMERALQMVMVSDEIYGALVNGNGAYYPVLDFILSYETADWSNVSRQIILRDAGVEDIYDAYVKAIGWYSHLIRDELTPEEEGVQGEDATGREPVKN